MLSFQPGENAAIIVTKIHVVNLLSPPTRVYIIIQKRGPSGVYIVHQCSSISSVTVSSTISLRPKNYVNYLILNSPTINFDDSVL